jgi:dihydroorotase
LTFTDADLGDYDDRFLVQPPLRSASDRDALVSALAEGVIDCVSSDHNPQTALDTECELELSAPGVSGLQTCFGAVWQLVVQGKLDPRRAVAALTTGPAKVLGKAAPSVRLDAVADFTLFAPDRTWQVRAEALLSRCKNTPWLGQTFAGQVLMTAAGGRLTFDLFKDQDAK